MALPRQELPLAPQRDPKLNTYLPIVLLATFAVAVAPILLVVVLRSSGAVGSAWVGTGIGVASSLLASYLGAAVWKTRPHSRDVLFGDLMLWGWVQRWRSERRLVRASDLLGLTGESDGAGLSDEQRVAALVQLTTGLEARDPDTFGHSRRVARHAAATARKMGLPRCEVDRIRIAGAIHDVGKLRTPGEILRKPGALTDEEFAAVKRHPVDGARMAAALGDAELTAIVRHHHERLDGTGYPDGLRGDAVPVGARVLAVADTFDAITSPRPYRPARTHKDALDIIGGEAGTRLDPDAVRAFRACYASRRLLGYWIVLAHVRPRVTALLGGGVTPASASTLGQVAITAATAVAIGGVVLGSSVDAPQAAQRGTGAGPVAGASVVPVARTVAAVPAATSAAAWRRAATSASPGAAWTAAAADASPWRAAAAAAARTPVPGAPAAVTAPGTTTAAVPGRRPAPTGATRQPSAPASTPGVEASTERPPAQPPAEGVAATPVRPPGGTPAAPGGPASAPAAPAAEKPEREKKPKKPKADKPKPEKPARPDAAPVTPPGQTEDREEPGPPAPKPEKPERPPSDRGGGGGVAIPAVGVPAPGAGPKEEKPGKPLTDLLPKPAKDKDAGKG